MSDWVDVPLSGKGESDWQDVPAGETSLRPPPKGEALPPVNLDDGPNMDPTYGDAATRRDEGAFGEATPAVSGFAKGASLNFSPQLAGAHALWEYLQDNYNPVAKAMAKSRDEMTPEEASRADAQPQSAGEAYARARDNIRRMDTEEAARDPALFTGGEVVGSLSLPIPGPGKLGSLKGVPGVLARLGLSTGVGAAVGGVAAAGDNRSMPEGMAVGGLAGLGGGLLGEGGSWLARKGADRSAKAAARQFELSQGAADDVVNSARGALGGETSTASRTLTVLEDALTNPSTTPAQKQAAQAFLQSPEGLALRQQVVASTLNRAPQAMAKVKSAEQALAEANLAAQPGVVQSAVDEALAHPVRDAIWPRVRKQVLDRYAVPAAGAVLGGPAGAVTAWAANAATGGRPSTAMERMFATPSVQNLIGKQMSRAGGAINQAARTAVVGGSYLAGTSLAKEDDSAPVAMSKSGWVTSLLSSSPERLGRFAAPLQDAARAGKSQLDAAIFVMSERDPDFRELLNSAPGSEAP